MRSFQNYITEAARSRGEEMEHAIIAAYEGKSRSGTSIPISVGNAIRNELTRRYKVQGPATSLGQDNFPVTKEWATFWEPESVPGSTRTPKTDILLGKHRVSVKMGASQLMGGGVNESLATFYAAADQIRGAKRRMLNEIETQISNLAPASVAAGQLAGEIKKGKDKVVNAANAAHKVLQSLMRETFEANPTFGNYFVHEAMSGDVKFGSRSPARADRVLSVNDKGTQVHWYSIDDDGFLSGVAAKSKVTVRFKTTSEKTKEGKTGRYRFWSVVSIIVNKMDEEFSEYEKQSHLLNEFKARELLVGIYDRIKNLVISIWQGLKSFLEQGIKYILEFLGLEPEVTFNNDIEF